MKKIFNYSTAMQLFISDPNTYKKLNGNQLSICQKTISLLVANKETKPIAS